MNRLTIAIVLIAIIAVAAAKPWSNRRRRGDDSDESDDDDSDESGERGGNPRFPRIPDIPDFPGPLRTEQDYDRLIQALQESKFSRFFQGLIRRLIQEKLRRFPPACSDNEFRCNRRQCIPAAQVCDGVADCRNGRDERDCVVLTTPPPPPPPCNIDQFTCGNGACIPGNQVCDGFVDCVGGEDELQCPVVTTPPPPPATCRVDEFTCADGACIPGGAVCDGLPNCVGGEDEIQCPLTCRQDEFTCDSGLCVPATQVCDGVPDCDDATDELTCPPTENIPALTTSLGLTDLVDLLNRVNLTDTLATAGPFTVLAPTNEAFADLPADLFNELLNNPAFLSAVLTYHVLAAPVPFADLTNELQLTSVEGRPIRFNKYPNGEATAQCVPIDVNRVDNAATNGLIHVLDEVMLPPSGTIVDVVAGDPALASLNFAIAPIRDLLNGPGNFTLFAPTTAAFNAIPPAQLAVILTDVQILTQVLNYHVVPATLCSVGLENGEAPTLSGDALTVDVSGAGIFVETAQVVGADISVTNGVVHVIDTVLLPPGLFQTGGALAAAAAQDAGNSSP